MRTLEEIEAYPRELLNATDIADLMHMDPQDIRDQAKKDASKLGFPVITVGHSIRIPKRPFIKFMRGELQQ